MLRKLLLENYVNKYTAENINLLEILKTFPRLRSDSGPWLAGGALLRLMNNDILTDGDLDFYFKHSSQRKKFISKINEKHDSVTPKSSIIHTNPIKSNIIHYQYFNNIEEIFHTYDFTICQVATDGYYIYCNEQTLKDIENHKLRPHSNSTALLLDRYFKYIFRGFTPIEGGMQAWFNYHYDVINGRETIEEYLNILKQEVEINHS